MKGGGARPAPRPPPPPAAAPSAYIGYGGAGYDARAAVVDSVLEMDRRRDDSAAGAGLALLEEALLDVAPDEALDMMKRRSMYPRGAKVSRLEVSVVAAAADYPRPRAAASP